MQLRVIDFDLSHHRDDAALRGHGTADFRSPELSQRIIGANNFEGLKACDVFSMGIVLFSLLCDGVLPFKEARIEEDDDVSVQLLRYLHQEPAKFWRLHAKL